MAMKTFLKSSQLITTDVISTEKLLVIIRGCGSDQGDRYCSTFCQAGSERRARKRIFKSLCTCSSGQTICQIVSFFQSSRKPFRL